MNNRLFWIVILIIAGGLIISANIFRDTNPSPVAGNTETPRPSDTVRPEATLRPTPKPSSSASPFLSPATCQISGQLVFLSKTIYENKNAKIVYQNVDDVIRQIYWKSDPDDGALTVGPNIFENLSIPDGEADIGVALGKEPSAKIYNLSVSITYGAINAGGAVEQKIANCVGEIAVDLSNI